MRVRNLTLALLCCALFGLPVNAAPEKIFYAEAGTMNGFGLNAGFGLHRIAPKFPIGFDFSAGYVFQSDPGNAVDARKIFINDATGGNDNIVESGATFFLGVDALYPIVRQSIFELNVAAGPRYSSYAAFFDYQGGNEAFKVYSNAWGFGVGFKSLLTISDHFVIGLETTVEYFFNTQLKGHGFFYNANNQDDNPRNNYRYSDADAAINQPLFFPRVQLLLGYKL
ncbi:MAG TPA: hypothetical protein PKM44_12675 [Turneriella sp.]|nr:hypothetical protein [Turneriella sp.]HNJ67324.1 hypothetical protein [Turneriella sp.]HNL11363.1 hypothetical protein [Turneriella sp.]HNL53996.1 hypothetical protein [Turneriella sp.]